MPQKRKYSDRFREAALKRMEKCTNVTALARQLGIRRKWLYQWREQALAAAGRGVEDKAEADKEKLQRRVTELEQLVGRQAAELDFFKGALRRVEAQRQSSGTTGGAASTSRLR